MTTARLMIVALLLVLCGATFQHPWTEQQRQVLSAIERLSAATATDGGGPAAYAAVLHPDFSRWTLGNDAAEDKETLVAAVEDWWRDGWRVSARDSRALQIVVRGDYAFSRRIVGETYTGPDGQRSASTTALAEVWVRDGADWLLLRVDTHPVDAG